jgi:putative tryptophan/tyrosine transport system substrate-binding protein
MTVTIGRRDLLAALVGGAAAWPLATSAQQVMPVVGYLDLTTSRPNPIVPPAFREGLAAGGFVEGRNVTIEARFARNQWERLAQFAAELVERKVAVIVALDSDPPAFAAKAATSIIPIVFMLASDPIKRGLVTSLNRPGGNMTGVAVLGTELVGKRLQLLCEMAPQARTVAYLTDPRPAFSEELTNEVLAAARALGRDAIVFEARSGPDIDAAFATLVERGADALVVGPYLLFANNGKKIIELAAHHNIPAIYSGRFLAVAGGLMSYGAMFGPLYRLIGSQYVAPVLRGTKPADLPIQLPSTFDLVINLKTAKALGLTVPQTLLVAADEVIE